MSRFNSTVTPTKPTVTNHQGGLSYELSPEIELVTLLLSSFLSESNFFESKSSDLARLQTLITKVDPLFAAKTAIYARDTFNMRSVSHVVAGELAPHARTKPWAKNFFNKIVVRLDDMSEIFSYYASKQGKSLKKCRPIPNAMIKGFKKAFTRFDAYQLAKYQGNSKSVSLVDLMNIVHPKWVSKNGMVTVDGLDYALALQAKEDAVAEKEGKINGNPVEFVDKATISSFLALSLGLLKNTDTWESKISGAGQQAAQEAKEKNLSETEKTELATNLKNEEWSELITSKKIGYMALIRNLNNILELQNSKPEVFQQALDMIQNPDLIKKSRMFPFRFFTAIKAIESAKKLTRPVFQALSNAIDLSLANTPVFSGNTLIVLDDSGSMDTAANISKNADTKVSCSELGAFFGTSLYKANPNADFMLFSTSARYKVLNGSDSVLSLTKSLNFQSGGTNFYTIFQTANKKYDRIIILSDMQGMDQHLYSYIKEYKTKFNADPFIYSFDLQGRGSSMVKPSNPKVFTLSGYSEKVWDIFKLFEQDKNALVNEINKVEL